MWTEARVAANHPVMHKTILHKEEWSGMKMSIVPTLINTGLTVTLTFNGVQGLNKIVDINSSVLCGIWYSILVMSVQMTVNCEILANFRCQTKRNNKELRFYDKGDDLGSYLERNRMEEHR